MKCVITFIVAYFVLAVYSVNPLVISGTLYDFSNKDSRQPQAHPDFNAFLCGVTKGIVEDTLGADKKPVLANTQNCVTSAATFAQWFNDVPGVNFVIPYVITAQYDDSSSSYTFTNTQFFPIDNQGYGIDWNKNHNFGFCFEIHTQFTYELGQVFVFTGDDDVWVFINDQLAIDLGGTHVATTETVDLDTLGLTVGATYDLDGFFCERHVVASDLVFSTSIVLSPCGITDGDSDAVYDQCDLCPSGDLQLNVSVSVSSTSLTVPITVSYTGAYGGSSYVYSVDFGDDSPAGTQAATSLATLAHTYASAGQYTITVTLSGGGKGCNDETASATVTVTNQKAPVCANPSGYGLPIVGPTPSR
jgi:fibro-slime domain-containing protein